MIVSQLSTFFSQLFSFIQHHPWYCVYLVVGPGAWIVFAYLMKVGRERMIKLRDSKAILPENPPKVSILVPAKDEGSHIATCISRVMQQNYPNFEVIAVNDRSSDETGEVLDALVGWDSSHHSAYGGDEPHPTHQTPDPNPQTLKIVHITELPQGWLGKCHALDNGVKHATGEWLFFVDSDVKLEPDALSKMLALTLARNYDAMSIMTTLQTENQIEKIMLPLLAATWATMFAADQTNEESERDKAVANGQVFLIRKSAYEKVGGHASVKDRIVEDVELMRLLKSNDFKVRFFAGRHLAATRMHTHLKQMYNGWARIFIGSARGKIFPMIAALCFMPICVLSSYVAIIFGIASHNPLWYFAGIVHWLVMTICMGIVWIWSGNSPAYALLLPFSVPIEMSILFFSIRRAISGKVEWRGSQLSLKETA